MILNGKHFPHGVFLAPMAGFTDYAMRKICHDLGAEATTTEMVSAKAVCFGDKKTFSLARIREEEGTVSVQLFGSEPDLLAKAAEMLSKGTPDGCPPFAIDINMGCPVPKVFNNGEGSALMKDPDRIRRIVRACTESTDLPISVKLRLGVDEKSLNAVECALAAEAGGASWITVHGRTRKQMYSGEANRELIRNVKNSIHIPLIANGDITDADSALSMLKDTGADGIMIGREAIGNPFVFRDILLAMEGKTPVGASLSERVETAERQLALAVADKGEVVAVKECRKTVAKYFAGFRGSAALRLAINSCTTQKEVLNCLEKLG